MIKSITELLNKWNNISPYSGGYLLISDDHPLAFHIGFEAGSQKAFVVLNTGKVDKIISSRAVDVDNLKLEGGSYCLKFILKYPSLDEIFVKLCWDLMESSRNAQNPLQKIVEQYKKWQALLQKASDDLLSSNEQKGLIGELLFLQNTLKTKDIIRTLTSWTGPEGSDQDFNFDDYWVEIKTTTISSNVLKISSLQQLDRNDRGYIVIYFIDPTVSQGPSSISLDEAVQNVIGLLNTESQKDLFDCKLAMVGYQHKDKDKYHTYRYRISKEEIFSVTKDFPRLTKDTISSEIITANYEIDLASIQRFKCQEIV